MVFFIIMDITAPRRNNDNDRDKNPAPEIYPTGYGTTPAVSYGKNTLFRVEKNRSRLGFIVHDKIQERMGRRSRSETC
jgi:hypothetical protein